MKGIQRLAKMGFELAQKRQKKFIAAKWIKPMYWKARACGVETVQAMEADYPDVEVGYEFVDAVAMRLVQWPTATMY